MRPPWRLRAPRDDLVVAGASAEISRQRVADFGLGRMRIVIEQRLGRHQEARRADAALQARVSRGTSAAADAAWRPSRESFDRVILCARGLDARASGTSKRRGRRPARCMRRSRRSGILPCCRSSPARRAGPRAGSGAARTGIRRVTVDRRLDILFYDPSSISFAVCSFGCRLVRRRRRRWLRLAGALGRDLQRALVSTPTIWRRNSAVPRMSSIGERLLDRELARAVDRRVVELLADQRLGGLGGEHRRRPPPRPDRSARRSRLSPSSCSHEPDADHRDIHLVARDEAQVGVGSYAARARRSRISTSNSPGCSTVRPGPVQNSSTVTSRSPLGPTRRARAPSAISAGVVSAAGEPLHRLPPTEARL